MLSVYIHLSFYLSFWQGTGVVTSVPSDAPDDIAALRDLKKKQVSLLFRSLLFIFFPVLQVTKINR